MLCRMFKWLQKEIVRLSGTRRFAAGALALYLSGWLAERAITLLWEKFLERQAPDALLQMSSILATDFATGMALMAMLVLFVPPLASFLFDASSRLSRFIELRSKRMSRREYVAEISMEAIEIAKQARKISNSGRWQYDTPSSVGMNPEEAWKAMEAIRVEQDNKRAIALQNFVTAHAGRASFIMKELVSLGYAKEVPRSFGRIVNYFCVEELANSLEEAGHRAITDLKRDGYQISSGVDSGL